jgi:hypothetical protein
MTRVPVLIQRKRFLIPMWAAAQVPWKRTIWVRKNVPLTPTLLAHELAHVQQAERHPWPLAYFAQWASTGFKYHSMPFEVEARRAEKDPWYRAWASDIIAARAT